MSDVQDSTEQTKRLENGRRNPGPENEALKRLSDSKVKTLENEIDLLREEVRSLRMILGPSKNSHAHRQQWQNHHSKRQG